MRICRQVRTRFRPASNAATYGSHLATHVVLDLLFLGGGRYTLSNSARAVLALIFRNFPRTATTTGEFFHADNEKE